MDSNKFLICILPGMLAPGFRLEPLAQYLQRNIQNSYVLPIGLRLSLEGFDSLVNLVLSKIIFHLKESNFEKIVLVGHSHGGRVAVAVRDRLSKTGIILPCDLILLGTPILKKPTGIIWYKKAFYDLSKAFRAWPRVSQPKPGSCKYVCLYSTNDEVVDEQSVKTGFLGSLKKVETLRHGDLVRPDKVGQTLLSILNQ